MQLIVSKIKQVRSIAAEFDEQDSASRFRGIDRAEVGRRLREPWEELKVMPEVSRVSRAVEVVANLEKNITRALEKISNAHLNLFVFLD